MNTNIRTDKGRTKVVIMAAGLGKRFKDAGYMCDKPSLVVTKGERFVSLLEAAIEFAVGIVSINDIIVLGSTQQVPFLEHLIQGGLRYVWVSELQQGAAMSANLASAHLSLDDRVLLMDCDNVYSNAENVAEAMETAKYPFSIYTNIPATERDWFLLIDPASGKRIIDGYSKADPLKYSFKNPSKNHSNCEFDINVGLYFFPVWSKFQLSLAGLLYQARRLCNTNEITILNVLSHVKSLNWEMNIDGEYTAEIPYTTWIPCGTPIQYEHNKTI